MSDETSREHRIAAVSELAPAPSMRPFEVGETKGLLVRLTGGFHAVSGLCPHAKAPLHEGVLCGERLVCPWHQSVFGVTNGRLLEPPSLDGLERWPVRVQGDEVFVMLTPSVLPKPNPSNGKTGRTVLIVGAGAAGQVAAETLRQEGFDGRVILVDPEPDAPYDRTNLSKHFLSGNAQREDLPLRPDADFLDRLGVERKIGTVSRLDSHAKTAALEDGETLAYDAAILASGSAVPRPLDIPGADNPRVCLLRSVADAERILALIEGKEARAVAIGASFIGMEAVSSLTQRGIKTTVISPDEVPFARQLGQEVGASVRRLHEQNGVCFFAGVKTARIEPASDGVIVHLESGECVEADVVVVGVGVRPATGFVEGVERADDGGVVVDEYLHAGNDLYAVGDLAEFPLPTSERTRIEHWRVAQQHAALAARNVARPDARESLRTRGFVPFFWTFHFGQRMNYVGHAREWDEIVFDGDPAAPPFVAYYLRDGRTVAAVGTHRDADLAALHELLRLGRAPTVGQLKAADHFWPPLRWRR